MLSCERYNAPTGQIESVNPGSLPSLAADRVSLFWVDLTHPSVEELAWLETTFAFHPLAMEDVRHQEQRAKVDGYPGYYFVILRTIHYHPRSHRIDSTQLSVFVGLNYLVTVHQSTNAAIEQARKRWAETRFPTEATSYLFYLLADVVVDCNFPVIDQIGDSIDVLDQQILSAPGKTTIETMFTYRRNLLTIRKILTPLRDVFNELIRSEEGGRIFAIEQTRAYFSDVYDHILRLVDFVDTYRDMLSGSFDAYQSSLANRLNENMQRLTVAATVLATSTVITGFSA